MIKLAEITIWYVVANLVIMFVFTIVCAIGGGRDLVYLFRELWAKKVDELDDGSVSEKSSDAQKS